MEMSYGEKNAWVSLAALAGAFGWYVYSNARSLVDGSLAIEDIPGEMIGLLVLIIVVDVSIRVILGIESKHKAGRGSAVELDERDALIEARSDRWPYTVMFIGAIAGIWTVAKGPMVTVHVLLTALVAAEVAKLIAQLVYYRRGV